MAIAQRETLPSTLKQLREAHSSRYTVYSIADKRRVGLCPLSLPFNMPLHTYILHSKQDTCAQTTLQAGHTQMYTHNTLKTVHTQVHNTTKIVS